MRTRQRNRRDKIERIPAKAGNSNREQQAKAILTRPKGRPHRDGNRRFERVRKETTRNHSKSKADPSEKEPKPERKTTQQALGAVCETIRKKTVRNVEKQHPDNQRIAKENPQHGREQEERHRRRAAGGAGNRKLGRRP